MLSDSKFWRALPFSGGHFGPHKKNLLATKCVSCAPNISKLLCGYTGPAGGAYSTPQIL